MINLSQKVANYIQKDLEWYSSKEFFYIKKWYVFWK